MDIRNELKVVLENVGCLGNRDPKSDEYQEKMVKYIFKLFEKYFIEHGFPRQVCNNGMRSIDAGSNQGDQK